MRDSCFLESINAKNSLEGYQAVDVVLLLASQSDYRASDCTGIHMQNRSAFIFFFLLMLLEGMFYALA